MEIIAARALPEVFVLIIILKFSERVQKRIVHWDKQ